MNKFEVCSYTLHRSKGRLKNKPVSLPLSNLIYSLKKDSSFEARVETASVLSFWTSCYSSAGKWENCATELMSLSRNGRAEGDDHRGPDGTEGSLVGSSLHLLPNVCLCEPK